MAQIKVRPLIKRLGKIFNLPDDSYLDPTTLGSGTPNNTKVLNGDESWVTPESMGYVPYTGATTDVNLGTHKITADAVAFSLSPTNTVGAGKIVYDGSSGSLSYLLNSSNVSSKIGQTLHAYVHNAEAVTITKGQAVYLYQASGNKASVKLAYNTSDSTSAKTFGLSAENITAGHTGMVICHGVLDGLNTGSYSEGDTLYLGSTAGTYTATKPYAPNHLVYLGVVERANNGAGQIYVKVQNGYELDEIHDVDLITTPPVSGNVLTYNGSLWIPQSPSSTFLSLTDTPSSYSGQALKVVRVNAGATALEFTTLAGGGDLLSTNNLSDVANVATARTNLGLDTTSNQTDSTNKRFVTDAQSTVIGNTSGSNTGDETNATIKTKLGAASSGTDGYLTSSDWSTFNGKQPSGTYATGTGTANGTNTGDQTSLSLISDTKANFNTACSDGNFLFVGDVTQYTDENAQDAVGTMIDTSLVYDDATPKLQRAALTGAVTASAGSNSTSLGSFTFSGLNTAVSDEDLARTSNTNTFTGVQTFSSAPVLSAGIDSAMLPNGLNKCNTAEQSQTVVSGTAYYITNSNIALPNPLRGGMSVGSKITWRVWMSKTAAGTGTFQLAIYRGTNGSTADTQDVLQTLGTQTAVVDTMVIDVTLVVTTTGASGAYFWTMCPVNRQSTAASALGFGIPFGTTGLFSGTKSSVAMNTAGLNFGLGFVSTTGTPTIRIVQVMTQAHNLS